MNETDHTREKNGKYTIRNILLVIGGTCASLAFSALYLYPKSRNGTLLSVSHASEYLFGIIVQSLIMCLIPIVIFILSLILIKKDYAKKMYLTIPGKWQMAVISILAVAILGLTVYRLIVREDQINTVFSLFYYFFCIALAEEFVCRDVYTYLLRKESAKIRYLVPNICFGVLHIFMYFGWGIITIASIWEFVTRGLLEFVLVGLLFQLLKEKSGTIWIPVLIHCLWDMI